jgi:xanthine/uracil permease
MLVIGLGTSVTTSSLPITGMSLAALVGIILNLILPNKEKNIKAKEV